MVVSKINTLKETHYSYSARDILHRNMKFENAVPLKRPLASGQLLNVWLSANALFMASMCPAVLDVV